MFGRIGGNSFTPFFVFWPVKVFIDREVSYGKLKITVRISPW
jgi:hypothetical protein